MLQTAPEGRNGVSQCRVVLYTKCSSRNPMVWLVRTTNRYQGGQQTSLVVRGACPQCESPQFKNNGHMHNGNQHHQWKNDGRQFVRQPESRVIDEGQRSLVERLLRENISLHGMCRAVGVSIRW
jgi:hypothetical protein